VVLSGLSLRSSDTFLKELSGSGKTTIGRAFCERHPDWEFIDGDWFFLSNKPSVILSNNEVATN
jgi:shikimate kinase